VPGDIANIGNSMRTYERPDVVGNPYVGHQTQQQWFNAGAFAMPHVAFGGFGRDVLNGPAYYNSDVSLFTNVPIHESVSAQIRIEAFNAFDLMNYANLATSVGSSSLGVISNIQARFVLALRLLDAAEDAEGYASHFAAHGAVRRRASHARCGRPGNSASD
jgi:hypothetical protein